MIARLVGRLARKSPEALIVDVHGVGYRVMVSLNAFAALPEQGAEVELAIHTHLRENAL
jgi:holliday junction DNA helicase RuvA